SSSLRYFDPEKFVLNIVVQNVRGLGRGRGFRVESRTPIIQGQEYKQVREKIAARILELLELLVRTGTISRKQVALLLAMNDDNKAKLALIEEQKKQQTLKITQMEKAGEECLTKLARSEDERKELEAKLASIESGVDELLWLAGLNSSRYLDVDAKFGALEDELRALRASKE